MKRDVARGFTTTELLVAILFAASLAGCAGVVWVAVHFVRKFW